MTLGKVNPESKAVKKATVSRSSGLESRRACQWRYDPRPSLV
jgi:hypothetical protein